MFTGMIVLSILLATLGAAVRSNRQKPHDPFRDIVTAELKAMDLTPSQAEAVNAWAWAAKAGWARVDAGQFPILSKRMETK